MLDDNDLPAIPTLEEVIHNTSDDLILPIVENSASAEDVPATIERLLNGLRADWLAVDWHEYDGGFGREIAQQHLKASVQAMLDRQNNPPAPPPPIDWGKRGPPPSRHLLDEE